MFNDAHQRKAVSKRRRNTDVDAFGWPVVVVIAALVILLGLESTIGHATGADAADQPDRCLGSASSRSGPPVATIELIVLI